MHTHKELYIHNVIIKTVHGGAHTYPQGSAHAYIDGIMHEHDATCPGMCFHSKWYSIWGCHYSLDWTTGLDYWTGLLDSPLIPKH